MKAGMMAKRIVALMVMALMVMETMAGTGGAAQAEPRTIPLSITSDRLDMDDQNQVATFTGHVVADDGRMRVSANRMTVHYDKKAKSSGGVREVKAEGQVVIQQDRDRGTADVVLYQFDKRTLELTGNEHEAVVRRGDDQLTGRRILVSLDKEQRINKVSVLGGENRRVSARITPSGLMQRVETPLREDPAPQAVPAGSGNAPAAPAASAETVSPLPPPSPPQTPARMAVETPVPPAPRTAREPVATAPEGEQNGFRNETTERGLMAPAPKPRRRGIQPNAARR
ncbi:MAG: hypothetical protein HQL91_02610 [Magnetococcales bacterium]|nr:hypothetical protein [Magnetococcales bacterium]